MPVYTPIVYNAVPVTHEAVPVVLAETGAYMSVRGVTNPGTVEEAYVKGDIISVYDTSPDGAGYVTPAWVIVKVTDADKAEVLEYIDAWVLKLKYDILQTDLALDRALIKSFTEEPGAGNEYAITWLDIQSFVEEWKGVFFSEPGVNDVRFSVTVFGLYTSSGLWGEDPASQGIVIIETDYNESTGVHVATIDISASVYNAEQVKSKVASIGGVIISTDPNTQTAIVEFYRNKTTGEFLEALKDFSLRGIRRRKYRIDQATVDNGINAGGYVETTKAVLNSKLIDKSIT